MTDEQIRARLAERLADLTYRGRTMTGPEAAAYARFLLPDVRAIAADELREAAEDQDASTNHICDAPAWLRDRADALTAQEPACLWAHGPVTAASLDRRGLCPVCADDLDGES